MNEAYSYDANGNRTMTGYATGDNNQLLDDGTYSYTYDVFNRRIAKSVDTTSPFNLADAAIERYVYDDRSGVASIDGVNVTLDFVDPDGDGATEIELVRQY